MKQKSKSEDYQECLLGTMLAGKEIVRTSYANKMDSQFLLIL